MINIFVILQRERYGVSIHTELFWLRTRSTTIVVCCTFVGLQGAMEAGVRMTHNFAITTINIYKKTPNMIV